MPTSSSRCRRSSPGPGSTPRASASRSPRPRWCRTRRERRRCSTGSRPWASAWPSTTSAPATPRSTTCAGSRWPTCSRSTARSSRGWPSPAPTTPPPSPPRWASGGRWGWSRSPRASRPRPRPPCCWSSGATGCRATCSAPRSPPRRCRRWCAARLPVAGHDRAMSEPTPLASERLGPLADGVAAEVERLIEVDAVRRIWDGDHTLWQPDPTEVTDRLGWLRVGPEVAAVAGELDGFAAGARSDGLTHAVVMGMGGSSLFPEVIARTFPPHADRFELRVLDTTDPAAIGRIEHECPLDSTLFVASSKSGGTVETLSHLAYFWDKVGRPEQFSVVTDPGSDLAKLGNERGFRRVWENRADIGGRYSALSYFGMVPAALAGAPFSEILAAAATQSDQLQASVDPRANPGLRLGAILGAAVKAGHDKVTLVIDGEV